MTPWVPSEQAGGRKEGGLTGQHLPAPCRNTILLESVQRDIEQALALIARVEKPSSSPRPSTSNIPLPSHRLISVASTSTFQQDDSDTDSTGLETVIESPLAILGQCVGLFFPSLCLACLTCLT
jgi:hypothetical protein